MKKVIFDKLKVKNFLSIGDPGIELDFKSGISVITGENKDKDSRNGVGKSSIIESIYWALFGETLRDIKKDKILHNQAKKECVVSLDFTVESGDFFKKYNVTRSLEPNKLSLKLNGEDISLSTMPKTDEHIKELIGANEEVFQNAVVMSANNTLPFMAQKKVDKRKFIEGILQLNIFSEMLLKARADYNEVKTENTKLSSLFIEYQKNLEIYQTQIEKNKLIKQNKINSILEKIKGIENKIKEISEIDTDEIKNRVKILQEDITKKENTLKNLEDEILPQIETKLQNQQQSVQEISSKIADLTQTKSNISNKQGECSLCKRPFEGYNHVEVEQQLEQIENELIKNKQILQEYTTNLEKIFGKKREIASLQNVLNKDIQSIKTQIEKLNSDSKSLDHLNERLVELKKEKKDIEEEIDPMEVLFKETQSKKDATEKELQEIQKHMSILDTVKFVVSEEGVKTFIIKKMLNLLNTKLNHYLNTLEAPCVCNFNETFEETIINEKGKECSYFNFSGGERKRIDLAILFMFQDILRNQSGTSFSLSMYDELFDSALDAKGVNKILEILKERTENYKECVYVVSHNKETLKADIDHVVLLQKINGKTELVS